MRSSLCFAISFLLLGCMQQTEAEAASFECWPGPGPVCDVITVSAEEPPKDPPKKKKKKKKLTEKEKEEIRKKLEDAEKDLDETQKKLKDMEKPDGKEAQEHQVQSVHTRAGRLHHN